MLKSVGCLALLLVPTNAFGLAAPISIVADLTDAPRKLYHADIDIPVKPGPLTLTTPTWIPGHHTPVGPVADVVGVIFTVNGKVLKWTRDELDLHEFHLVIPPGVRSLHAQLDSIVTQRNTANVAVLHWEKLLLYPAGVPSKAIVIHASVRFPTGWGIATALTPTTLQRGIDRSAYTVQYEPTDLETLQDSPVFVGQYYRQYELGPKHYLDVFATTASGTEVRPKVIESLSHLVREATALYGPGHYNSYHFLLTLTPNRGGGTEHAESSDNGMLEDYLSDDAQLSLNGDLLPHEYTHSWNEKYRRPAGETVPDFATPMKLGLLWIDEGLTQYLGKMLAARVGLTTRQDYLEALALEAAKLDYEPGKAWRSTADTAIFFPAFRTTNIWVSSGPAWSTWRRSFDYYQEGDLLWLDVDTTIRKLSGNKKSLRDFLLLFLGKSGPPGPSVMPYDLAEVVSDLNQVVKADWAKFLDDRVYRINPRANLAGIEQGGYRVVYTDEPSAYERRLLAATGGGTDAWFSIGLSIDKDGTILDVRKDGPADKSKLGPGEKIIAVGGNVYSKDSLHTAIVEAKTSAAPIQFIVQNDVLVAPAAVDYHEGATRRSSGCRIGLIIYPK